MAQNFDHKAETRITNIVVASSLEHDIPLEKMAATLPNTEYNPEQFPGLVLRIDDPRSTALIFSSGKIVCTGTTSLVDVRKSITRIIEAVAKIGVVVPVKEPEFEVVNMVAKGNIGMDLNLNSLTLQLENTEYEPEQFPGLVYKLPDTSKEKGATFLLFRNGKIVCTGTKNEQQVEDSIEELIKILSNINKK